MPADTQLSSDRTAPANTRRVDLGLLLRVPTRLPDDITTMVLKFAVKVDDPSDLADVAASQLIVDTLGYPRGDKHRALGNGSWLDDMTRLRILGDVQADAASKPHTAATAQAIVAEHLVQLQGKREFEHALAATIRGVARLPAPDLTAWLADDPEGLRRQAAFFDREDSRSAVESAHVTAAVARERQQILAVLTPLLKGLSPKRLAAPLVALCDLPTDVNTLPMLREWVIPRLDEITRAHPESLGPVLHALLRNRAWPSNRAATTPEQLGLLDRMKDVLPDQLPQTMAAATVFLPGIERGARNLRIASWIGPQGLLTRTQPPGGRQIALVAMAAMFQAGGDYTPEELQPFDDILKESSPDVQELATYALRNAPWFVCEKLMTSLPRLSRLPRVWGAAEAVARLWQWNSDDEDPTGEMLELCAAVVNDPRAGTPAERAQALTFIIDTQARLSSDCETSLECRFGDREEIRIDLDHGGFRQVFDALADVGGSLAMTHRDTPLRQLVYVAKLHFKTRPGESADTSDDARALIVHLDRAIAQANGAFTHAIDWHAEFRSLLMPVHRDMLPAPVVGGGDEADRP